MKTVVLHRILPTAHVFVFHNKFSMAFIADESLIYHGYSNLFNYSKLKRSNVQWLHCHITNSSDVFANLFPQFCPRIFLGLSNWKRKQIYCWSKTVFFSVCQLKKKSQQIFVKKIRRFGIRNEPINSTNEIQRRCDDRAQVLFLTCILLYSCNKITTAQIQ